MTREEILPAGRSPSAGVGLAVYRIGPEAVIRLVAMLSSEVAGLLVRLWRERADQNPGRSVGSK